MRLRRSSTFFALFLLFAPLIFAAPRGERKIALNIGDPDSDLVYTPTPICRIIDTRAPSSGILTGGTPRDFYVSGNTDDFAAQGGTAGGCGIPDGATSVMINFVAVAPAGAGNLRGSAYPNAIPVTGSIINYQRLTPSLNIANGIPFPICDGGLSCTYDLSLVANGADVHVVADVAGYFRRFPTETISYISSVNPGEGLNGGGNFGEVPLSVQFGGDGSASTVARGDHVHPGYARTVIVSPGATDADSGNALLAALAAITDESATNRYVLKIEPGIYYLGTTTLVMQPFIDLEGSGQLQTIIRRQVQSGPSQAVIRGADDAELRSLTAETSGTGDGATAMIIQNTSPRLSDVTLRSSGGSGDNYGVYITDGSPVLDHVTITTADGWSTGLSAINATPTIRNSDITATGVTNSYAVSIRSSPGVVSLTNVNARGVGGGSAFGIHVGDASASLQRVTASAKNGSGSNHGLFMLAGDSTPRTVTVDHSTIIGSSTTIFAGGDYTIRVGASQLDGGNISGGTVTCIETYDENFVSAGFGVCP